MKLFFQKALPHIVAVILFFALSSIYFSPAFQDYDLRQGDIDQFIGMSKEIKDYRAVYDSDPLWTNSMFGGMPAYQISVLQSRSLPAMIITALRTIFPGPVGTLFLALLSFYILGLCMRINPWVAMLGSIGFGFASVNVLYLGAGHASKVIAIALMPAVLGGVVLTFRRSIVLGASLTALFGSLQLAANHLQMTYYLLILLGLVAIGEGIRLLAEKKAKELMKIIGVLMVAAVVALLPNMTNMLTTYEYSKYTTRGPSELTIEPNGDPIESKVKTGGLDLSYMLDYSFARGEFWSMMIPNVKGGKSSYIGNDSDVLSHVDQRFKEAVSQQNGYWGDQRFTGGAFYFGAIIMALFIVGMFVVKDRIKWALLLVSVIAVLLSWKDYSGLTIFFAEYVPLFDKFRDTKMMLVVIQVAASLMAILTIDQLVKIEHKFIQKPLLIGSGVVMGVLLLFAALPTMFFDFFNAADLSQFDGFREQVTGNVEQTAYLNGLIKSLESARIGIFRADLLRSLFFAAMGIAALWLISLKKINSQIVLGSLILLVLLDLWTVDRRYLNNDKSGSTYIHWVKTMEKFYPFEATASDLSILESEVKSRQLETAVQEMIELKEAEIGKNLDRRFPKIKDAARFGALNLNSDYRVLSLNNPFNNARVSYFHKSIGGYHGAKLRRYQELIDFYLVQEQNQFVENANSIGLDAAFKSMKIHNLLNVEYLIADPNTPAIPNRHSNGNAWFVSDVTWADNADEEIIKLGEIDPLNEVVISRKHQDDELKFVTDSLSQIVLESYLPNELVYKVRTSQEGFVVFSEIYYPLGWQAYINDEPVNHYRVNYSFRGLPVPAGENEVVFKFEPASYEMGQTISTLGSILLVLVVLSSIWYERKNNFLLVKEE
jgi:hypothetical protein